MTLDLQDVEAIAERVGRMLDERYPVPGALLDANQAGALLNVLPSWILAEARADRIPHVRLGRYVRFDADDLTTWMHARKQGPIRKTGDLRAA